MCEPNPHTQVFMRFHGFILFGGVLNASEVHMMRAEQRRIERALLRANASAVRGEAMR